jgi:hypothetical protein
LAFGSQPRFFTDIADVDIADVDIADVDIADVDIADVDIADVDIAELSAVEAHRFWLTSRETKKCQVSNTSFNPRRGNSNT